VGKVRPLLLRRLSPASLTSGVGFRTCHDKDMELGPDFALLVELPWRLGIRGLERLSSGA